MKKLYVSILNADLAHLADQIASAEAGGADGVHVDVMDGHFVPNLSLGPQTVEALRSCTTLTIDVHLMIERPERWLEAYVSAGADSVTVHLEATPHPMVAIQRIQELGAEAGLALNPGTSLSQADEYLPLINTWLIMTVNPGFGGQSLVPSTLDKVARARGILDERQLAAALQVDGGVKSGNIQQLSEAGADTFVVGTAVFREPERPDERVRALRALL